jgi:hypothetical protein
MRLPDKATQHHDCALGGQSKLVCIVASRNINPPYLSKEASKQPWRPLPSLRALLDVVNRLGGGHLLGCLAIYFKDDFGSCNHSTLLELRSE